MAGSLIVDEQRGFRAGTGCVDQIFTLKQIDEKAREKKCRVCVGFIDLEKAHVRVNTEALWQVFRMYDVGGKLLSGIKSMYVESSDCVRVKGGESDKFRKDRRVRRVYHVSSAVYMDGVMKEVKMGMGRRGESFWRMGEFLKDGREQRLPGL